MKGFPAAAHDALRTRSSGTTSASPPARSATSRAHAVAELPDWEELREAGAALKRRVLRNLDGYLLEFEAAVSAPAAACTGRATAPRPAAWSPEIVQGTGAREVVKVKSLTTDEIELNETLGRAGIDVVETDLAELIVQLAGEEPSHILVPAIHKNRVEIRDLFRALVRAARALGRPA